jgi:hypothetical protein
MAKAGNALQVTIVLDSGLFLTDEEANKFTSSEVGYFTPHIAVYRDGEKAEEIDAATIGTNCRIINVRKLDDKGKPTGGGIRFSVSLLNDLLRLKDLYGHIVLADEPKLDCKFHFNSGHFCSSKVKPRTFKEYDANTNQPTGKTQSTRPIAHDIVVHYDLAAGESLTLVDNAGNSVWSSSDRPTRRRIEIEILANNSTASMFYREGLKLRGQNYWMPNQGDPPPPWSHGGHGGGGGG